MSTASVLIPADDIDQATPGTPAPRYTLLLSTDPAHIEAAQRLRHDVFTSEPGFAMAPTGDGLDADRFDQFCDHLLVREDGSGELVGCYRMLPPPGAIAAGGLYTATEFDVRALDALRPSLVEMGRAVVRADHRNGGVVLLMWAGILAYLDRCGYDHVTGCVSVPTHPSGGQERSDPGSGPGGQERSDPGSGPGGQERSDPGSGPGGQEPGSQLRGVRDFVLRRHGAPQEYTVRPYRPVVIDGRGLDEIAPPARVTVPALMRGYLRLGAQVCGEPAHDPDFGVGDFPALLDKRRADVRYLKRLRSVSQAADNEAGA